MDKTGDILVLDTFLFTGLDTGYLLMLENKSYKSTLSPELLQMFLTQQLVPIHKFPEKSEVFSIAILIMAFTFRESYTKYYDFANYKINYDKLYKRMNMLIECKYDENLCDLIVEMLDEAPKKRPSYQNILEKLSKITLKEENIVITKN